MSFSGPFSTPDLYDQFGEQLRVVTPALQHFGGNRNFAGTVATIQCPDDNSRVAEAVATAGNGRVLVVDGGGALSYALLGDRLAQLAVDNGWAGIVVYGCVRDIEILEQLPIGIMALAANPRKTEKRDLGDTDIKVELLGEPIAPGDWLYADRNGVVLSASELPIVE